MSEKWLVLRWRPTLDDVYTLSPEVAYRREDFGGLVFLRDSWVLHKVNQTGFAILELLSSRGLVSREALHQALSAAHGELDEAQRSGVDLFLDQLLVLRILLPQQGTNDVHSLLPAGSAGDAAGLPAWRVVPRALSAPTFVWWDITSACNLKCRQCYSSSGAPLPDELTTEEVKGILRQLAEAKVFYIYFLGGEPFLRKDFLSVLEYCRSLGIQVMISSNGWFITPELARSLVHLRVKHVRVSIDGATAATHDAVRGVEGSFDKAVTAVRTLKQAGIPVVGISPTVMHENVHEVEMLVELARDLQANEIQLVQVCAVGRGRQISPLDASEALLLKDIVARKTAECGRDIAITGSEGIWDKPFVRCVMEGGIVPEVMGCGAGRTCAAMSPNGQIRACLLFQYEFGDLRKQSFQDLWEGTNNPKLQWLRGIKEGCKGCNYARICSGPCPMQEIISPEQRACFVRLGRAEGV